MAKRGFGGLGILLAVSLSCGPKIIPGLSGKVEFHRASTASSARPRHGTPPAQAEKRDKDSIEVVFDRPVVAADKINKPLATLPLRLSPPLPGTALWTGERTLTFAFQDRAPGSTAFEVVVPAGLVALDGKGLADDLVQHFETERLKLETRLMTSYPTEDLADFKWADKLQSVVLHFNQMVLPEEVEKNCHYLSPAGAVGVRITGTRPEKSVQYSVEPTKGLPVDAAIRFACDERLRSVDGPLGFRPAQGDAAAGSSPELAFHTYGPLIVESVSPADVEVNPDNVSLVVRFSNPLREGPHVQIEPKVADFAENLYTSSNTVRFSQRKFLPNTNYKVTIAPGLQDVFGQALAAEKVFSFRTGSAEPKFDVKTGSWVVESSRGSYPVWVRNLKTLEITASAIPESKLMGLFPLLNWWDDKLADLSTLKIRPQVLSLDARGTENDWRQMQLGPQLLGASVPKTGFFYFAVTSPEVEPHPPAEARPSGELLVNITNLGLTAKLAGSSGLVWVTALDTGKPVPGAEVVIRDRNNKTKWKGKTDADGMAVTPGRATLAPRKQPPPAPEVAEEGEGEGGGDEGDGEAAFDGETAQRPGLLVFARVGADVTFVDADRSGRFDPWNFQVPADLGSSRERLRGFIHSDRGLYRPGDTVRLRGLVRLMKLGQGLEVPSGKRAVKVTVLDPKRGQVVRRSARLSPYGGWNLDVKLSEAAPLGDYSVTAELGEGSFHEQFAVEEYRAATMEAKVSAKAERYVIGETVHAKVAAQYLYGSPVRGGSVRFRMHLRPRTVSFPDLKDYSFDDDVEQADAGYGLAKEELLSEDEQRLNKLGEASLAVKLPKGSFERPQDLMIAAEVSDESNQSVASTLVVPVNPSRILYGIALGSPVLGAGKPVKAKLVAVSPDGKRMEGSAKVTFTRREHSCVWEVFGYDGRYRCDHKSVEVFSRKVDIPADAPAVIELAPPQMGDYDLVVAGKDSAGNPFRVSRYLWAYGEGEADWPIDDAGRFSLVADKASYQVGDVAHLLVRAPLAGSTAMLTLEREGVLERRLVDLSQTGSTLDVPITDQMAPNVYASLMLVRGRTGKGRRGLPALRMGVVNLPVETGHKRLKVEVSTDRESYRPGDKVTASVKLSDASGAPVRGEVALFAADEGVLSLIAFKTPDPLPTFFASWGLGVRTTSQYDRLARLPDPDEKQYATGGDGAGRLGTPRSRFMATAYWNPRVETDEQGRAEVSFDAPDNLTAFRVMAVAADAGDRFGSGDRRFTVRKPLQLVAAMPRFLSVGDETHGGVMVINETGQAGNVEVKARVKGAKLLGASSKTLSLPVGGRALVGFPVKAEAPGSLDFTFSADLGGFSDGLKSHLPILYPTSFETSLVAAGGTEKAVTLPVVLGEGVVPGSAELDVSIDPDGLAGIEEGLRALIEYPYGCLEQTTSRLIPLVAVEELARALGLPELDGAKLQRYIQAGIEKLYGFQAESGGFSLWRGGEPETYLTAFGLWGLSVAQQAGHRVDKKRLQAGVKYLRQALVTESTPHGHYDDMLGYEGGRAFALHVLALLGEPQPGLASKMIEDKKKLPRFGEAFLAQALASSLGKEHEQVRTLVDGLVAAGHKQDGVMTVRELDDDRLYAYYSSDTRTSAIVTDMLVSLRPQAAELPALVAGLVQERRAGQWSTTQENLYSLIALTHYLKNRPAPATQAVLQVDGKTLFKDALPTTGLSRVRHFTVPIAGPVPLAIQPVQGKVFYQARLRFRRDREHQPEISEGITLGAQFLDPVSGAPIELVKAGQVVKLRVSLLLPEYRSHLAVSAFLPAGLEVMNTRFATTMPQSESDRTSGNRWWELSSRELRDERVDLFYDFISKGQSSSEFMARATTAGVYVVPAWTAEEMYKPERRGRTALRTFTVTEK